MSNEIKYVTESYIRAMKERSQYKTVLRDWFAGQALAGMNAADRRWDNGNEDMACAAYSQADAMLAARKANTPEGDG